MSALISRKLCRSLKGRLYSVQAVKKSEDGAQFLKVPSVADSVKVVTANDMAPLSRLLFVLKAGSRYENGSNYGVTHLLRHTSYLGSYQITAFRAFKELEKLGTRFNTITTRDYTMYSLTCTRNYLPAAFKVFYPLVQRTNFKVWEWRDSSHNYNLQYDLALLENQPEVLLVEGLHEAAYRNGLGNSLFAAPNLVGKLTRQMATNFVGEYCQLDRMAVAATGIEDVVLTDLLEEAISSTPSITGGLGTSEYRIEEKAMLDKSVLDRVTAIHGIDKGGPVKELVNKCATNKAQTVMKLLRDRGVKEDQTLEDVVIKSPETLLDISRYVSNDQPARYYGGEKRLNRVDFPQTYVSFAVEGPSLTSKDRLTAALLQQLLSPSTSIKYVEHAKQSKLESAVSKVTDAPFMVKGLSVNYSDSGLFGFTVAADPTTIGKVSKAALNAFLANTSFTDAEVARGKNLLKSDISMRMERAEAIVMNLAEQVHITGEVNSLNDTFKMVDAIKTEDVARVAKTLVGGKLSMSSVGNLINVPYLDQFTK